MKHVTGMPQVGDWADHVSLTLDPRRVVKVSDDGTQVWLDFGTGSAGPFPAEGYKFTREED